MDYEHLADTRRIQEYVTNMRPAFNKRAVFSDETENYRTPAEPEPGDVVNIRIRTKSDNVDFVYLVVGKLRQRMKLLGRKDGFDYYGTDIKLGAQSIRYFFEIISGKIQCYYNKIGITKEIDEHYPLELYRDFIPLTGQKGQLCIRFL